MRNFPQQAIVLAAGLGTRLRPLTHHTPKPILPLAGVPILFYNLYLLKEAGVRDIVINLHHLPDKITSLLKDSRSLDLKLRFSLEPKILGTAGGIAQALERMKKQTTLVLNGDILCDIDLKAMVERHRAAGAKATLACVGKNRAVVESYVETDARGRILRIAGKPETGQRKLRKTIFAGIHVLEPALLKGYRTHRFGCIIRQVYQPALARGEILQAYFHRGSWWDLGSLQELSQAGRLLSTGKASRNILRLREGTMRWARRLLHGA